MWLKTFFFDGIKENALVYFNCPRCYSERHQVCKEQQLRPGLTRDCVQYNRLT